ncbi:UNVERIFIED_CONTAM: hypothetical protein GTU68_016004 [Idotea baltica]|nr:hypothetical protein [Idotea baltica]
MIELLDLLNLLYYNIYIYIYIYIIYIYIYIYIYTYTYIIKKLVKFINKIFLKCPANGIGLITEICKYFFFAVSSIWCYQCVSSHPGCGLYDFDIRYYWSHQCPNSNDKCVKIIEKKGADTIVTRDCLSNLEGHHRNIPADHYEGCRPSADDPLLAHYVTPTILELDIDR